jgi:hypothetical protein
MMRLFISASFYDAKGRTNEKAHYDNYWIHIEDAYIGREKLVL